MFFVLIAASIWAAYAAGLGYFFGDRFETGNKTAVLLALGSALLLNLVVELIRHHFRKRRAEPDPPDRRTS